jgi:hypothetical protein
MKRSIFIILLAIAIASAGCTKTENTPTSGMATIDNTVYISTTYYSIGFSFSEAKLISNLENPGPDITVYVNKDIVPYRLIFQADNLLPSFYKFGEFADEATAITAFKNLTTFTVSEWSDMADPIAPNQVWIYRSGKDCYSKIRIISTVNEMRQNIAYGECKFQWVHQPDGSTTFPAE